ncbi:hypothetical protein BOTBODRAFT_58767 [Botryobasidium botryosum FD-172 SS1]|uniref:WAC domain-containing protein n=1 Tax=Botryobasidium botryosum (strain FD-172 SS1) TaxID=930990 RepID=A0A067M3I6_BOTB1|nr:hypothetical protein BOTBODRAFT_58767 [Botryobasidium botryosum FD-172 SS1]
MPLVRRKKVITTDIPDGLEPPSSSTPSSSSAPPDRPVYYLPQTGEIFLDYESYAARMTFYKLKVFQCEVTGKGGLDFFQALDSERAEALTLHARFPEQLKAAVLRSVQWQIMGRLDHLVELVYDRFKDRYFPGEKVFIDLQGDKYYARIMQVFPPKTLSSPVRPSKHGHPLQQSHTPSSPPPAQDEVRALYHSIGGTLAIPVEEVIARDDPNGYFYRVRVVEEGTLEDGEGKSRDLKWGSSELEVKAYQMSRDRLSFSKSILRRFIRDCVDRSAALASPWTVKRSIAEQYGIETEMPEDVRLGVEGVKQGEKEKRKKVWEEKHPPPPPPPEEEPPKKKQRKMGSEEKEREKERLRQVKEAEKQAAVFVIKQQKPPPIKYPTEDLDIRLTEREKKAGKIIRRPPIERNLPFSNSAFESMLMTWNFLICFSKPFNLSTFNLDEYENALRHSVAEPPCQLVSEIHASLLHVVKELPQNKRSTILSTPEDSDTGGASEEDDAMDVDGETGRANGDAGGGVPMDQLAVALKEVGNGWEKKVLKEKDGRKGWEATLVGCLRDHASIQALPNLRRILTFLTFAPIGNQSGASSSTSSPAFSPPSTQEATSYKRASPTERYSLLPPEDKIAILAFLCDLSVTSKMVRTHMEACDLALTELRKEKIEVNREKKRLVEEIATLDEKLNADTPKENGVANGTTNGDVSVDSVAPSDIESEKDKPVDSDAASDATGSNTNGRAGSKRQRALQVKTQSIATAKQRAIARGKAAEAKAALAERRRLDEDLNRHEKRLENIERDFRRLLGVSRARPLGKDRFHNRVWWFDGLGGGMLVIGGGQVTWGTGRIFIQGPSEADLDMIRGKGKEIELRREEEEGEDCILAPGEWGYYSKPEQAEEYLAWLNAKGNRELSLKNTLVKWWDHILPGMRKRHAELATNNRPVERRSLRAKANDLCREPYMAWTNRKAVNNT